VLPVPDRMEDWFHMSCKLPFYCCSQSNCLFHSSKIPVDSCWAFDPMWLQIPFYKTISKIIPVMKLVILAEVLCHQSKDLINFLILSPLIWDTEITLITKGHMLSLIFHL